MTIKALYSILFYSILNISISENASGFKLLFRDAKDVQRIKTKMITGGVQFQDLPYRDMEKLRQVGSHHHSAATRSTSDSMNADLNGADAVGNVIRQDCVMLLRDRGHKLNT